MTFYGNFEASATPLATALEPVLEITLNDATWDGSAAFNVSSAAVKARGKAYDPRVIEGGWQAITRQIDLRAYGLDALQTSVTIADPDNKVRDALLSGDDQRNSAAVIYRVVPGSTNDYATLFTGLLDSWEFKPGQVTLRLKTDERCLRSFQPAWPYLKSEWFWMAQDSIGTYIPLVYGKHDSSNLNLDHGMIPTVLVWGDGNNAWYATNLAPADLIKDVYVDGVKQAYVSALDPGNAYEKVYGSYAGGKIATIIGFNGGFFPATDAKVTCDLYGYSPSITGVYDGSATLTNPVSQMRHFLVNFAVDRTKGYISGNWNTAATIIDGTSWSNCEAWADSHGLEGSRYLTSQRSVLDIFREWLESYPMFRAFWNAEGKIELALLSADWPGYWAATPILRREDELANSFRYELDTTDVTGKVKAEYLYDSVDGKFLRSLDVQDLSSNVLSDSAFSFYWSPARQV